jgi:DNA-binding NtrC family response regulator
VALILIVHGDPVVRSVLGSKFKDRGHEVATATDAEGAMEAVARQLPSVILLGLHGQGDQGRAFIQELRAREIMIPVVVLSEDTNIRQWAQELGAGAFLQPPHGRTNGFHHHA